jgi:hypothetical protein
MNGGKGRQMDSNVVVLRCCCSSVVEREDLKSKVQYQWFVFECMYLDLFNIDRMKKDKPATFE